MSEATFTNPDQEKNVETDLEENHKIRNEQQQQPLPQDFPEGGFQAWTVVAGSFLALFSSFGVVNSYG